MAGTLNSLAMPAGGPRGLAGFLPAMGARGWICAAAAGVSALALSWLGQGPDLFLPSADAAQVAQPAGHQAQSAFSSGVVEAIRELSAEGTTGARHYEMTIRLRDGSARISHEMGAGVWRAGDAIRLIGPAPRR
jgi:hypothetical protein